MRHHSTGLTVISKGRQRCSWLRITFLSIVVVYATCFGLIALYTPMERSSRLSQDTNFLSPISIIRDSVSLPFAHNHQNNYKRDCVNSDAFHAYEFSKENGCFIHPIHHRPHCQFKYLQIDLNGVASIRNGGEGLYESMPTRVQSTTNKNVSEPIMGQPESYEMLKYEPQTFQFSSQTVPSMDDDGSDGQMLQSGPPSLHYMNDIFQHSFVSDPALERCPTNDPQVQTLPGITFFIGRESYANLYHSMQIWFNAYFTIHPSHSDPHTTGVDATQPMRLIFLDAHPRTPLDQVWEDIFGIKATYLQRDYHSLRPPNAAKRFLCLEQARMIPSSPNAPFSVAGHAGKDFLKQCPSFRMMSVFTHHILEKYNLLHTRQIPGRIVVIDRVPYLAHPRSRTESMERQNIHLASVAREEIEKLHDQGLEVSLEFVTLVNQSMAEQIQSIRTAQVLIGDHGAGLTHLLFLDKNSHVLETSCRKLHFKRLVDWSQHLKLQHHCLPSMLAMSKNDLLSFWQSRIIPLLNEILIPK